MSRFEVREVFRLTSRKQIFIAGIILEGSVRVGDTVLFDLQEGLCCSAEIIGVEYLDRVAMSESLVCLVFAERDPNEATVYSTLCPSGTLITIDQKIAHTVSEQ